jgi:hypothetical protein
VRLRCIHRLLIGTLDRVLGNNRSVSEIVTEELDPRNRCQTSVRGLHFSIEAARGIRPDAEKAVSRVG